MTDVTFVCLYKPGTFRIQHGRSVKTSTFDVGHVHLLRRQIERAMGPVRFVCMTDLPEIRGVETVRLRHDWPGWWAKMEMFRLGLGRACYLDLDVLVLGDLSDIVALPGFAGVRSPTKGTINGSLYVFGDRHRWLYDEFAADAERYMAPHSDPERWADQAFVSERVPWADVDAALPGQVRWYKGDLAGREPPPDTRLVIFTGKPRPWEAKDRWIRRHYRRLG